MEHLAETIEPQNAGGDTNNDADMLAKFRAWQRVAIDLHTPWLRDLELAVNHYMNRQWLDSELKALKDRAHFSWNLIRPLVNLVAGMHRQTKFNLRPVAVNSPDDGVAEVLNQLIRHIEFGSGHDIIAAQAFLDGIVTGRGWRGGFMDFSQNPLGEIAYEYVEGPHILYDPFTKHMDLRDAEFLIRYKWFSEAQIREFFPELNDRDRTLLMDDDLWPEEIAVQHGGVASIQRTGGSNRTPGPSLGESGKRRRVAEFWWREMQPGFAAMDLVTQSFKWFDKRAAAEEMLQTLEHPMLIAGHREVIRTALVAGSVILDDVIDSPYGSRAYPYWLFPAGWFYAETFGMVKDMIDPQRHFNKVNSQGLDAINKHAKFTRVVPDVVDNPDQVSAEMDKADGMIKWPADLPEPHYLARPEIPVELFSSAQQVAELLRSGAIGGISPTLQGLAAEKRESGRAAALRQQQGAAVLAMPLDNWRLSEYQRGIWTIDAIQNIMQAPTILRVVGESDTGEATTNIQLNEPIFQDGVLKIVNDLSVGRYDIRITDEPQTAALRMAQFAALLDTVNAGIPIPPEIIIETHPSLGARDKKRALEFLQQAREAAAAAPQIPAPVKRGTSPPPNAVARQVR